MLCWITILGGVLIMMGQHSRSEALFYYFRLEDQVPETHLLRLIEKHISFAFVREKLKAELQRDGASIDRPRASAAHPLDRLFVRHHQRAQVGRGTAHASGVALVYRVGVRSGDSAPLHVLEESAWKDFRSRNCSSNYFKRSWRVVWKPDWCKGDNLSVDGSFVEANASKESRIPREQLAEAAQVNQTVHQYLVELEQQNPTEEPVHEQKLVSTTDPDATYATKGGTPARLGYYDNYLVDNHSCVIVGVQATAARMSQETVAAQDMIARFAEWQGREPASVAADATYGNGEFLQWLMERGITPYMRTRDSALRKNSPLYGPERFTYLPESNSYLCPAGEQLNYGGHNARNRTHVYIGTRKRCGGCAQKAQCTSSPLKYLAIHMHEPARQRARDLVHTPAFVDAQGRERRWKRCSRNLRIRSDSVACACGD